MADQGAAPQSDQSPRTEILIAADQLVLNERGEVVVKNEALARVLRKGTHAEAITATPQGQEQRTGVKLSSNQFTLGENGALIIKNDELTQALQNAVIAEAGPEQGGIAIGINLSPEA